MIRMIVIAPASQIGRDFDILLSNVDNVPTFGAIINALCFLCFHL